MAGRVMLDTSALYMLLLGPPEEARRLADALEGNKLYIIPVVVAELLHVLTLRVLRSRGAVKGSLSLRRWIRSKGYPREVLDAVRDILELLDPVTLPVPATSWDEVAEVAASYRLPSNDALIALACREHGIDTVATLDEDFRRVPWLRVIP